jgi:hypothetical protein
VLYRGESHNAQTLFSVLKSGGEKASFFSEDFSKEFLPPQECFVLKYILERSDRWRIICKVTSLKTARVEGSRESSMLKSVNNYLRKNGIEKVGEIEENDVRTWGCVSFFMKGFVEGD